MRRRSVLGLATAAAVLVVLGSIAGRLAGEDEVSAVGVLIAALFAACAAFWAARRSVGHVRNGWFLLGASSGIWAVGQVAWVIGHMGLTENRPNAASGFCYLAAAPLAVAGVLTLAPPSRGRIARFRLLLDGCMVAAALLLVAWVTMLGDAWERPAADPECRLLAVGTPIGDVVMLTVVIVTTTRARGRWVRPLALLGCGLTVRCAADVGYVPLVIRDAYDTVPLLNIVWVVGFLFTGLAALYPAGHLAAERHPADATPGSTSARALLPYLPVAVALAAPAIAGFGDRPRVTAAIATVVVFLLLGRQALAVVENARLAATLRRHAYSDPLTGLANRGLFASRLSAAVARTAAEPNRTVAVLLLDMDGFKAVNDSLGHAAGDRLLAGVAARLRTAAPKEAVVARLGGDEFGVLVETGTEPAPGMRAARKVLDAMIEPVPFEGRNVQVSASVGVAEWDGVGERPQDLLRDADVAMYAAKAAGKSRIRLFEPGMRRAVVARAEMEADLRLALERNELVLYFQPTVDLDTRTVQGAEALVRWQHPTRGLIGPTVFVPVAEQAGLLGEIDRWVLAEACRAAARWQRMRPGFSVSVNMAASQFVRTDLVATVAEILDLSGLPAHLLTLELTETALVEDAEATIGRLGALAALGVRVAIDDFGTGYSSLAYLRRLPVSAIKIDRSFVDEIGSNAEATALVQAILGLARTFGLGVVAEGVEDESQLNLLIALGCRTGQGYLFSPPVPGDSFTTLLAGSEPVVLRRAAGGGAPALPPSPSRAALPSGDPMIVASIEVNREPNGTGPNATESTGTGPEPAGLAEARQVEARLIEDGLLEVAEPPRAGLG